MQEYWLVLSIAVTISIGIVAFTNKIFATRAYNVQFSALVLYAMMFVFSFIIGAVVGISRIEDLTYPLAVLSVFWGAQFYLYSVIMMNALRYLPTSTYFISVRLASSFLLLGVGIVFFADSISYKELIGFAFGVLAMSLLFEKQTQKVPHYKKGLLFLIAGIFTLVFGHSVNKTLSLELEHISLILILAFGGAFVTSLTFGFKHIRENRKDLYGICQINLIQSLFYFFYFYCLFYVYNYGDLGISYKIQSYSPFIPIVLSALIYKEKITQKQGLGIFLTLVSLYFFT